MLLILRHGETAWTITGQHTGRTEVELTEHGRAQAAAQAPVISAMLGDAEPLVVVSPRLRTLETARLACPGLPLEIEPRLAEFDYGDYEGLTHDEIDALQPGWDIWTDGCPGGESINGAADRVDAALTRIRRESRPVIAVTHGHTGRILAARALGLDPSMGHILDSATGSVSAISTIHGSAVLSLWNQIAG